jgi:hypothetical protein
MWTTMKFAIVVAGLLSTRLSLSAFAQADAARTCPPRPAVTDSCVAVSSWTELKDVVEAATDVLILCPFDIYKDETDPLEVVSGLTISCRKTFSEDECKISGEGVYVNIRTAETTAVQGLRLEHSEKHAVTVRGVSDASVHSFCDCEFIGNKRQDGIRGGAFKTEAGSGIIHVESCYFEDNFSSLGAAIYTRSAMTYVFDSIFVRNRAEVSTEKANTLCS